MSDPMFVRSCYANTTDLYEAKAKYYMKKYEALLPTITALTALLEAGACPNYGCNNTGSYFDNTGEMHQCQWCYEVKAALKENTDVG